MSLDPTVFGTIAAAHVFSSLGDQIGTARIQGQSLDVQFASAGGGVGSTPGFPMVTVEVPVLPSAKAGSTAIVSFQPGAVAWKDARGATYAVTSQAATFTVAGTVWVQNVTPGGSPLPAGATVRMDGGGFSSSSAVSIEGVALSGTQFVSAQQLNFTLAAAADLTGKRILVTNPDGSRIDYYSSLVPSTIDAPSQGGFSNVQPIFPLQTYAAAGYFQGFLSTAAIALENQTPASATVILESKALYYIRFGICDTTVTIPPYGIAIRPLAEIGCADDPRANVTVEPSVPIRMVVVGADGSASMAGAVTPQPTQIQLITVPGSSMGQTLSAQSPLVINWQSGTPVAPVTIAAVLDGFTGFTVASAGGSWLSVSPGQGTSCAFLLSSADACPASSLFAVTVTPGQLGSGTYQGSITVTPTSGFQPVSTVVPVTLVISPQPTISVDQTFVQFSVYAAQSGINPATIHVSSNGAAAPITVQTSTQSGQNWFTVSPTQATTPASLTVTANPTRFNGISDKGTITITGPGNAITIPVSLNLLGPVPAPGSLQFSTQAGQNPRATQFVTFSGPIGAYTVTSLTEDGGTWLRASQATVNGSPEVEVDIDATGLASGTYHGVVLITSPPFPTEGVPVQLAVGSGTPPVVTVVNAASAVGGAVAPGEIVTFFGQNLGPLPAVGFTLDSTGRVATNLGGTEISFDGTPAPLLYANPTQVNAIVPYEIAGKSTTTVSLSWNGMATASMAVPVAAAAPAVFTLNSSGQGQAAVLNSDNSVNSATNRAARGSIVQIFATGAGVTSPAGITGEITSTADQQPVLPVHVTIGAVDAQVVYAAAAPDAVSGLFQINAVVPTGTGSGPAVPLQITVGKYGNLGTGVTIALQ